MSILDRHPAPWSDNGDAIVDAAGNNVLFSPGMLACASSLIIDLQAELSSALAENARLREVVNYVLAQPCECGDDAYCVACQARWLQEFRDAAKG